MDAQQIVVLLSNMGLEGIRIRGSNVMSCCPFHEETKPSWGVSVLPPYKHGCFSCGARGTLVDVLVKIGGYSPTRAHQLCGVNEQTAKMPDWDLPNKRISYLDETELYPFMWDKAAARYCRSRKLNTKVAEGLGLLHHFKDNRLLFPWRIAGKLVGVTGRAMDDNPAKTLPYFGTKKGSWLYFPDGMKVTPTKLVLVEGEIDALRTYIAGFNVAALSFGSFTEQQAHFILTSGIKEAVLFFDDDETGRRLADYAVKRLGKHIPVGIVNYKPFRRDYLDKKLDPGEMSLEHIQEIVNVTKRFSSWKFF